MDVREDLSDSSGSCSRPSNQHVGGGIVADGGGVGTDGHGKVGDKAYG